MDYREKADVCVRTVLHGGAVSYGLQPLAVSGSLKNSGFEVISHTLSTASCHFPDQQSPKILNRVMMAQGSRGARVSRQLRAILLRFFGATEGPGHLSTLKPRSVLMVLKYFLCFSWVPPLCLPLFFFSVQRRHRDSDLPSRYSQLYTYATVG